MDESGVLIWLLLFFPAIQFSFIINQQFLSWRKETGYNAGTQINADGNNAGMPPDLTNQTSFQLVNLKMCSAESNLGRKILFCPG